MKKILSLKFCGTVEHVCTDRNGAHLRMSVYKKYDLINGVSVDVSHKVCADIGYWNGYDYESKTAGIVRSLKEGDHVAVIIDKSRGFFGGVEEKITVVNYTLEDYENLSDALDLSNLKNSDCGVIHES